MLPDELRLVLSGSVKRSERESSDGLKEREGKIESVSRRRDEGREEESTHEILVVHQGKELDDERSEDVVVGGSGVGEGVPNGRRDGGSNVGGGRLESALWR